MDAQQIECAAAIGLPVVEHLHPLGHRLEVQREIRRLFRLSIFVERYPLCRTQRVAVSFLVGQETRTIDAKPLSLWVVYREVYGCSRISKDDFAGFQLTLVNVVGHCHWVLDGLVSFCLSRHCNEGE